MTTDGEMGVQAFAGGRRITLDPIMEREPIPLPVRRVETLLPCGFHIGWLSGEGSGEDAKRVAHFEVTCGAGVGGRWLSLEIELGDGSRIYETVDMVEFTRAWIDAAVSAGPSPEVGR